MKLYEDWHNDRYFWQCYFNLQEKYDCGGIPEECWSRIEGTVELGEFGAYRDYPILEEDM